MKNLWIFLAKLIGISTVLSVVVKYGVPYLPPLPKTLPVVLTMIGLPAMVVALVLMRLQLQGESLQAEADLENLTEPTRDLE